MRQNVVLQVRCVRVVKSLVVEVTLDGTGRSTAKAALVHLLAINDAAEIARKKVYTPKRLPRGIKAKMRAVTNEMQRTRE